MMSTPGPFRPEDRNRPPVVPQRTAAEREIARVTEPARLLRMSDMVRTLLDEAQGMPLDAEARGRLRHIHLRAVEEVGESVAPELREELERLMPEPSGSPSEAELRILQGQLVGWLDGVFQGIKAGLALQQASGGLPGPAEAPGRTLPERPPGSGPYL
ncbi:bacterial proteasome activator family protein [Actinomadura sp. ATCC 31491]|uniref:Bacterial proteasome activator n=1 Tax=Actinomadura luzonensis TaxID=2805427 RepID=A0ABT0FIZ6_9ACTN|nr:proteasome activator [Actinomadura luzonensis]MCK2212277.1 bacterial proteasome activator family protein [Actinomadura luzonensis]